MHEKCTEIIADLFFAYVNKDESFPHQFEIQALEDACEYLKNNYSNDKYNWFENTLDEIKGE